MRTLLLSALAFIVLALPAPLMATTIYVDCNSPNDPGSGTIGDPFRHIQDGIDAATGGDTVIVRDGTYTGTGNKDLDFGGKAITLRSQNGAEVTIIDCEDSGRGFWFHLAETASSVVDGFTICNANTSSGGGFFCHTSSPAIRTCTITLNTTSGSGGGIYCYENGDPTITNCTITYNTVTDGYGGGIFCWNSDPVVSNCTISGNASIGGGGIRAFKNSDPQITNCTISGNTATGIHGGGGLAVDFGSSPTISGCTISGNSSDAQGGGVFCFESSPVIFNCMISDNTAPYGGGISCHNYDPTNPAIINCTISGNTATYGGGLSARSSDPALTNCILWGNGPDEIYVESASPAVTYSCVQDDDPDDGVVYPGVGNIDDDPLFASDPSHDYYLSQVSPQPSSPCVDAGSDTSTNLGLDAYSTRTDGVVDTGTVDMGYHVPAIIYVDDNGPGDPSPGNPGSSDPDEDGTPEHPFDAIQEGIGAATDGCTVLVLDGTYTGTGNREINFGGKAITVTSENGPDVTVIDCEHAGLGFVFKTGETMGSVVEGFIIKNGDGVAGTICFDGGGGLIRNCLLVGNGLTTQGGAITVGSADVEITDCTFAGNRANQGAAIFVGSGSALIRRCLFTGNYADQDGGACYIHVNVVFEMRDCIIAGNRAKYSGGVTLVSCSPASEIASCLFVGNLTHENYQAGAIWYQTSDLPIVNCTLASNAAGTSGGAVYSNRDNLTLTNCILWGNSPDELYDGTGTAIVSHCDVEGGTGEAWFNPATCIDADPLFLGGPSGMWTANGSYDSVTNTVTLADTGAGWAEDELVGKYVNPDADQHLQFLVVANTSDTMTIWADWETIDNGSSWVNAGNTYQIHDYHIQSTSPCIDRGTDVGAPVTDMEGDERYDMPGTEPDPSIVDIGVDECCPPPIPLEIVDIHWDEATTSVVLVFSSTASIEYAIEVAQADAYSDSLTWTVATTLTATTAEMTTTDDLSTNPLTHAFRFYRVKRSDESEVSQQTAGVFELPIDAAATSLYFMSTPLVPDPEHNSVADVFGEGTAAQIPRSLLTVSDLDEINGAISRMRYNFVGEFNVLAGSAFTIEPGIGYEVYVGLGFLTDFKLRLTGYVPEGALTVPLTKENNQAVRWMGYSLPRTIKLSELGLVAAVTPLWAPTNKVRLLPAASPGWFNYTYDTGTSTWSPSDPDLVPGMGIVFIRAGFDNLIDELDLTKWYLYPPNTW